MHIDAMKYMEYSYIVDVPIKRAFECVMDIEKLNENVSLFENATLKTNSESTMSVGKTYCVSVDAGIETIETKIVVEKIDQQSNVELSYNYKTIAKDGAVTEGTFLPWESMTCLMSFIEFDKKTRIKTIMYANGKKTFGQKILAKFLSLINVFQQKKINRRVKNYVEKNA